MYTIRLTVILLALLLSACASTPVSAPINAEHFNDTLFKPLIDPIDSRTAFALSPQMHAYVQQIRNMHSPDKPLNQTLLDALYRDGGLKLEYDASTTRNAAEAFDARSGNCLSLVLMTAAIAKHLGIAVRFQSVFTAQNVSREGNMLYFSDHVNLVLGKFSNNQIPTNTNDTAMTVDFLRPAESGNLRARAISESRILAMYLNNRAVETLAAQHVNEAYWWAKNAIESDRTLLMAYNTLGLIYQRSGHLREAENTFRYVLSVEPDNHAALANLAGVLRKRGNSAEAFRLENRLTEMQPVAPYYYFDVGLRAMRNRDFEAARRQFSKEIQRAAYHHEFHYWLAQAYIGLKDFGKARKHMQTALENALTSDESERYTQALRQIRYE